MVKIKLLDNRELEFPKGITALEVAKNLSNSLAKKVIAVKLNDVTKEITTTITEDSTIQFLTFEEEEGKEVFWHSSAHIMAEAIEALYPGVKFGIGPTIDNGFYYDIDLGDKTISDKDFSKIEKKFSEIVSSKGTFERQEISKADAMSLFTEKGDIYKQELISELEDGTITLYKQGAFTDLCRGPHIANTGIVKAMKIMSVAGAYWRGDEKNKQLTRIYAISFPKKKLLDEYLVMLEEAKKRDHRKIGKEMELFTFSQEVGMGLPLWLPKGAMLRERLEMFLKKVQKAFGYEQVICPHIGDVQLYKTSGHFQKYGADSFQPITTPQEGEEYMLKPMNCPHHCEIYKFKPRSYKDLPVRMAEFGTVYRYEQSGELHGLTRVRSFTQDDAHIFCTPEQLKEEFIKVIDIIFIIFKALSFDDYVAQISLRDPKNTEKYIGSDENWEKAEAAIIDAAAKKGLQTVVETGEAAFYGPKLDFMVKDAIGRKWQLGTIQVDYNLPERFNLEYTGADNQKHRPIMIHRAPFGSMERFCAVLIEHTGGKFPLWLTPEQAVVMPISEKFNDYAKDVVRKLNLVDVRAIIDDRNEKIGRKIRDNELKKIPYLLIVGEQEVSTGQVAVRRQGEGDKGAMSIDDFAKQINGEVHEQMSEIEKHY